MSGLLARIFPLAPTKFDGAGPKQGRELQSLGQDAGCPSSSISTAPFVTFLFPLAKLESFARLAEPEP
ncbi:MAG: hypothetical protein ACREDJ_00410 [Methylocella sp.]